MCYNLLLFGSSDQTIIYLGSRCALILNHTWLLDRSRCTRAERPLIPSTFLIELWPRSRI